MKKLSMERIDTVEAARDKAIAWQEWSSQKTLSYYEVANWQDYFKKLARKFPELKEEFLENAII
jgi:hypothetical protein